MYSTIEKSAIDNNLKKLKKLLKETFFQHDEYDEAINCILFWSGYHCNWNMIRFGLINRRKYGGLRFILHGMACSSKYNQDIIDAVMFAHKYLLIYLRVNEPNYPWIDISILENNILELLYIASTQYNNNVFNYVNNFDYKKTKENTTLCGLLLIKTAT